SDGRPTLGMSARELLRRLLDTVPEARLIPAHIWTPWYAVLGSRGGFDAIEECFGDLTPHIVAVETGLSSDPPMNGRVSALDRFTLVSNSDLHSPGRLARNATVFLCEPSYPEIVRALEQPTAETFGGTLELFPEQGKYHLDGHRACGVCLHPRESRDRNNTCPQCGKPLTLGVLHRVETLADRPEGAPRPHAAPFRYLVPLPDILAEILGQRASGRRLCRTYHELLSRLGSECRILLEAPEAELVRDGSPELAAAVLRLRSGRVRREPGFDGRYGSIRVLDDAPSGGE
ncbi:MAG: hypothetical protein JXR77_12575, partial [Lentisphaeria bacterium]|nr:hypothetical protein [Lentisphaeria bacterium]